MDRELEDRIRKAKDDSWEAGYFAGRDGDPPECPANVDWPSQWRIGYAAAVEDKAKRATQPQ